MEKKSFLILFLVAGLVFSGCDTQTKTVDACGDGFLDPGEQCDTDVGDVTCESLGHYNLMGTLSCRPNCSFDLTDCGGRCGDGNVDSGDEEDCDGENLNGNSCQSLGHGGGTLGCNADCTYDRTGCTTACGNGYVEGDELCDDGNLRSGDGCSSACGIEEGWECEGSDPSLCVSICGDGLLLGEEACDGADLDGRSCGGDGYYGGTLTCTDTCVFDWSGCESAGRCDDGLVQTDEAEVCDGDNLNEESCQTRGFYSGTLTCNSDCRGFNTSQCSGRCGDGAAQGSGGEVCDQSDLQGQSCITQGYHGGLLGCNADCLGFNLDGCAAIGRCGDSLLQSGYGELCDGANLNGQSCISRGYHGGQLMCNADCRSFNEADCAVVGRCGDSTIQGAFSEVCDGASLGGQTCISRGYYGGTLACAGNCLAFDESNCGMVGRCGDSLLQTGFGEVCDGTNTGGQTCQDYGYYSGTLTCSADCHALLTSGCSQRCGDSTVQGSFGEVCDGANLNGQSCISRGFHGGQLTCNADCHTFNEADCATAGRCGDSLLQTGYGEVCDGSNLNGQSCVSRGWYSGTLACGPTCLAFDESNCNLTGRCGDNAIQTTYGEVCDGTDLMGRNCTWYGYYGGTLACATDCRSYDFTNCSERCGDDIAQSGQGEVCDGSDLLAESCITKGYYGGTLTCMSDCHSFNLMSCQAAGRCGDGNVQSGYGEQCDGGSLNGQTCLLQGYHPGVLQCDAGCRFVFSSCGGRCGDNLLQSMYEVCDGSLFGTTTCRSLGHFTGTLSCQPGCLATDASACLDAVSLDSWGSHSCVVLTDGSVRCWGTNTYGQLGDGTTTTPNHPVVVTGLLDVLATAGGQSFTCALGSDGLVRCWGRNHKGQLGDGTTQQRLSPVVVSGLTGVVAITAGDSHACAVLGSGAVHCWGWNGRGQLGNGTLVDALTPVQVLSLSDAESLTAGVNHTCAVRTNGTMKCWGGNDTGQLGDNSLVDRLSPVDVFGEVGVMTADAGYLHTCSLLDNGTVHCWGAGTQGQLGTGGNVNSSVPLTVPENHVVSIAAGLYHTCLVHDNGSAKCWGANSWGQLGDGTNDQHLWPTPVQSLSGASFVSLGQEFSCALVDPGLVRCWGWNDAGGLLGDGTWAVMRLTPVLVVE